MARILVVEDEAKIAELLTSYLRKASYQVSLADTGKKALEMTRRERPDLVLLDLMLPDMDGLEVCRQLRQDTSLPVIMVTARDEETDRVMGLELGADDYIVKPFSPREVMARVKAVLRRASPGYAEAVLSQGSLIIDRVRHQALCHGQPLPLTLTEFRLLEILARQPGRVYTREQILDMVQGLEYEGYDRTVDAHIKNLRRKIEEAAGESHCRIVTVRGVGYKLEVAEHD
ncbi:MAG: response regulator transcription factor [Chloroflexi bacterium]|nr:response regulator transcription factor [Chloroflexota bacterium]